MDLSHLVSLLCIFSCVGYKAKRATGDDTDIHNYSKKGAWFIREFVLACEMFAHEDHLLDLVTKVRFSSLHKSCD